MVQVLSSRGHILLTGVWKGCRVELTPDIKDVIIAIDGDGCRLGMPFTR